MMKRKLFNQSLRTALLAAMCLISLSFVSCSGDDDDEDDDDITLIEDTSSDDASDDEETTSSDTTYINGYAAVDLGLSVKWATCNIGADSPEDYGSYFAWAETETKDEYNSSSSGTYSVNMSDLSGSIYYDAATANWGSSWRMPTYDEMQELIGDCTWTWTKENGVKGYLVTGSTGNSIFLPAAGYRDETSLKYAGSDGNYWTSTPSSIYSNCANSLFFYSTYHGMSYSYHRYYGLPVRPVIY